jgi:hypothetical protein
MIARTVSAVGGFFAEAGVRRWFADVDAMSWSDEPVRARKYWWRR